MWEIIYRHVCVPSWFWSWPSCRERHTEEEKVKPTQDNLHHASAQLSVPRSFVFPATVTVSAYRKPTTIGQTLEVLFSVSSPDVGRPCLEQMLQREYRLLLACRVPISNLWLLASGGKVAGPPPGVHTADKKEGTVRTYTLAIIRRTNTSQGNAATGYRLTCYCLGPDYVAAQM